MNIYFRKSKQKGYTLAEVLITVAILLILMAIAVPAIFSIRKNLRQKALDNKAEIIYTAVQNNLTKLRNNGNSSLYGKDKATKMNVMPSDATEKKTLYYVTAAEKDNTNNAANILVTTDTVDTELYSHYWVVEYNPESASVYAVFYSETRSDYTIEGYNSLRYKDERLKDGARVGYYGGDVIDGGNTSTLAPKITITNEEKLVASISCIRPDSKALSFEITLQDNANHKLTLKYKPSANDTILVHDADDLHVGETPLDSNETGSIVGVLYTLNITLDDLTLDEDGNQPGRFVNLYGANGTSFINNANKLDSGTPLTITVKVKSASSRIDGLSTTVKTNSLFADNSTGSKAVLMYGRHLQNLDQASGVSANVTEAEQQSDIHFEQQDDKDGTQSWYSSYEDMTFTPITNQNLRKFTGQYQGTSGTMNTTIYHLTVKNQKTAGLFATLPSVEEGVTIDSVRLSGMKISSGSTQDGSSAGAIAGETMGTTTITNCQVFLEKTDVDGKTAEEAWISGAQTQGGLIGKTSGGSGTKVTVNKSFAATVMGDENSTYTGGLIGESNSAVDITESYSDSYLTGKTTGGIIASAKGTGKIESCYTVGYQKSLEYAGGFIGAVEEGQTIDCSNGYTAVTWLEWDLSDTSQTIHRYSVAPITVKNIYYLNGGEDSGTEDHGIKASYRELSKRAAMTSKLGSTSFVSSAKSTTPYNLRDQGLTSYSYPSLDGLPHYGDWEASFEPGSLVYYEAYADGSYGFYGANISPTLSDSKTVVGDGYGIIYDSTQKPEGTETTTVVYQNGPDAENDTATWSFNGSDKSYQVSTGTEEGKPTYYIYPLPQEVVNAAAISGTYYQKLTINGAAAVGNGTGSADEDGGSDTATGNVFYYNPHFAKTAVNSAQAPDTIGDISIRTARQLYHLSLYYPDYKQLTNSCKYVQELDINYGTYQWADFANVTNAVTVQQPIGATDGSLTSFAATYEGKYHEIRGISFQTKQTAVGFVGENAGRIQNVFIVSDYNASGTANPFVDYTGQIQNNRTVYMGVMAGINSGTIRNCAVCGYDMDDSLQVYVQRNGTVYMGGFVGSNRGTVMSCQSDCPSMKISALYGTAYMGGFAGENTSIIQNSYAVGKAMVTYAKGSKSVIGGFTAKNSGVLQKDYCAVAITGAGSTDTYGFSPRGGSIASNCYYLNGGTFEYLQDMHAFDNNNGSGTSLTYKEMVAKAGDNSNVTCKYNSGTTGSGFTDATYPFTAVVQDGNGTKVHYGNWQSPVDLGAIGVLYWEWEEGGANPGYHFSYIGYIADDKNPVSALTRMKGSTLCQEHDDGGIVTQYGYGYYYLDDGEDSEVPDPQESDVFQTGDENQAVSEALSSRLDGFKVVAFTTAPAIDKGSSGTSYMTMTAKSRQANAEWTIHYKSVDYVFTINPFFANAMQYGGEGTNALSVQSIEVSEDGAEVQSNESLPMPGTEGSEYEIRSIDQLQYMNWNYNKGNAVTVLDSSNYTADTAAYPYLGYMSGSTTKEQPYYLWTGTESPTTIKDQFSDYNNSCKAYRTHTENTSYWEFVQDDSSGTEYEVETWSSATHWVNWYNSHTDYTVTTQTLKGYWKWVGDTDVLATTQDSSQYRKVDPESRYSWIQSHDVDADMSHDGERLFTQIGSLYDTQGANNVERADAYMTYFNGSYDGNSYSIQNVEIRNSGTSVGLFGCIIGAKVQNIILYSENGNYIQRLAGTKSWYTLGGLCGLAAVGQGNTAAQTMITNCTVSGYTIQDNSERSSWGDGNVGGLIGTCTMDLEGCSAVNNIVLNSLFINEKSDGVSVRTGGLVGSMRGNITNCYTGGEISCTAACLTNAKNKSSDGNNVAKIFIGGISGGIYIKNGGNLTELLGTIQGITGWKDQNGYRCSGVGCDVPTTVIKNCYTYIKLPDTRVGDNSVIHSVNPIGSNGETPHERNYNCHVLVKMENCYYYGNNIPNIKSFTTGNAGAGGTKTNVDNSQAFSIDWEQLAGEKEITVTIGGTTRTGKLLELLNVQDGGGNFGEVTVYENGQNVDGKYSFPGDRTDLDGENYPFPTILTQKTASGQKVNVHYGGWPLEGIYWKESRASMDIFDDLEVKEGDTQETARSRKTFELEDDGKVLTDNLTYDKDNPDNSSFIFVYSSGDDEGVKASLADEGETDAQAAAFSDGEDDSTEGFTSGADENTESAASTQADTGMEVLSEDDPIAEVVAVNYDTSKNKYVATVEARRTGTTVITVYVTVPAQGTTPAATYTATFSLTVTANLTIAADPDAITQLVHSSTDVTMYAVPTAQMASANSLNTDTAVVGMGSSMGDTENDDSGNGEWVSDETDVIAVSANDFSNMKNLASLMTWKVEADQVGPVTVTMGTGGVFTVTSESADPVTLTVTGTYAYNEIPYTFTTWIEVSATQSKGISWSVDEGSTQELNTGEVLTVTLNDPDKWLAESGLTVNDILITEETDDTGLSDAADIIEPIAKVQSITPAADLTSYTVQILAVRAGTATITVRIEASAGEYTASFILAVQDKDADGQGQNSDAAPVIDNSSAVEDFSSDTTSEDSSGWENQSDDYVDMIPDEGTESGDGESSGGDGWGSGE